MGVRDTINSTNRKGFRVSAIIDRVSEARKQRLDQRLDKHNFPDDLSQPMFRGGNLHVELAERSVGTLPVQNPLRNDSLFCGSRKSNQHGGLLI